MAIPTLQDAVADFGRQAKTKLANAAIRGEPEEQLRAPIEQLVASLAQLAGKPPKALSLIGETSLAHLATRPDFAVLVSGALTGFIEVKAPGKGYDPRKFRDKHDREQWEKLKSLPNLIYTDGNGFTLCRNGEIVGTPVALEGDVSTSGAKLAAPQTLQVLFTDFFSWEPEAPRSAKALAEVCARLCRLLREEVKEQLAAGLQSLKELHNDWRKLLFPDADDDHFADGYAQAVTFGLLMARAYDIPLEGGIDVAATKLKRSNTLIGTALGLLTDSGDSTRALTTSLDTLVRVLSVVNWHVISKDKPEAWLLFYEDFLAVYDNALRKLTGSYYTPPEVVSAMVRLADEALKGPLFERAGGFAHTDVTVADPAVGTGTFLLGVLRQIADNIKGDQGEGAVAGAITAAARRLFGFELQFGPFAVAQLRLLAEMRALSGETGAQLPHDLNLFITNTLGNPFIEDEQLPRVVEAISRSRRDANRVKREQPIMVVIGNPPYKEKAEGRGGWIESVPDGRTPPLDRWKAPVEWGVGAHGKHLKNLYIYFWRWATLKVFGTGLAEATRAANDLAGFKSPDEEGLVSFISVSGFLNGPGFEKMRDDLRRTCSAIWVIDCTPEGHQPPVQSRIFQGVQQPVCIVMAARKKGKGSSAPAKVKFRALPSGNREEKFAALARMKLTGKEWQDCPKEWRAPFLPEAKGDWGKFPYLGALFGYNGSGVMAGRTWVIAPDPETLRNRWNRLVNEKNAETRSTLFHPHMNGDRTPTRHVSKGLVGHELRSMPVANDKGSSVAPVKFAFRTLDRQWIIPDARLINRPNPNLWNDFSLHQAFLTGVERSAATAGPAIAIAGLVPELNHYNNRGGRVYPLWANAEATKPNIKQALLEVFAEYVGGEVSAEDAFAYIAGVMAHPAFTRRFAADLKRPGLRLPLTADGALFRRAVSLGREVIWLHTYGERFADAKAGRPKGAPRMAKGEAPVVPAQGAIPPAPEPLPDAMTYDAAARRLKIGKGWIDNVTPQMWAYEVSGKNVLTQWFSYRKRDRSKPPMGDKRPPSPLEQIIPDGWLPEYTSDLIDLLNVLGRLIALEPAQAALLEEICAGPLIKPERLKQDGLWQAGNQAPDAED